MADAFEPIAWIATKGDIVHHFSKHDGWDVQVVLTEQRGARQAELLPGEVAPSTGTAGSIPAASHRFRTEDCPTAAHLHGNGAEAVKYSAAGERDKECQ